MSDSTDPARPDDSPAAERVSNQSGQSPALSLDCEYFLQVAAVVGTAFVPGEVALLLRQPVAALLPVINEALRNRVLCQGDDTLFFRDGTARQDILERIPVSVLRQLRTEVRTIQLRLPAQRVGRPGPARTGSDTAQLGCLTDTERVIAQLVGTGMTNRQVATRVSLSPHTVNYHLRRIFRKLDIRSRVELARILPGEELTA
ncbi:helix-turn-helix transcriptional regulator [Kutzneria sp. NPDC051319]|uniref:response regulator transcription factor n=1 Tax=Kutzneria sp. NPDC051319 TaxID=3155047 RepID=UPI003422DE70